VKNIKESNGEGDKRSHGVRALMSLVVPVFRRHRMRLLIGFVALITVDFMQLMVPRVLKVGVDGLSSGEATSSRLFQLSMIILAIGIIVGVLRFVWRNLIIGFSRLLERDVRERIFNHTLKMDPAFFDQQTTGKIMAHISNDLNAVQMACGMGMVAAVDGFVMSSAAIMLMLFINVKLTLLAMLPMPFLALSTRFLSSKLHRRFNTVQEEFGILTEFVRSTLVSIRLIKGYSMESFQTKTFDGLGKKYVRSNLQVAMIQGFMFPVSTLVGNLGLLMVLLYGGRLVVTDIITIGDFVAFTTYLYMLIWPIMAVGWVANLVQRGLTSLDRIYSLLSRTPLLKGVDRVVDRKFIPRFQLKNLRFHYPESKIDVLKAVDLEIKPGILGVTGPTGSGKTTICKLLARLYPVPDGTLFLDGEDVNTLPLDTVRSMISYAGQEPILFSDTIYANIAFGNPEADRDQVEQCAKIAGVHNDIIGFQQGYETMIGERGVTLSGGQKQRVALARALLYDRPVLLIDDGLSAVDVQTENHVLEAIRSHFEGKTVVIVSHRIKLLSMTDRIIILDDGKVTMAGTHDALLKKSSFYQAMHSKQVKNEGEPL